MSPIMFLWDEDTSHDLLRYLREIEPTIDILVFGEHGAPPLGTKDPALLIAAETLGRTLVSSNRRTMPVHMAEHFRRGHHTAGIILLRREFSLERIAQDLRLIWFATTPAEWVDRLDYIPYGAR